MADVFEAEARDVPVAVRRGHRAAVVAVLVLLLGRGGPALLVVLGRGSHEEVALRVRPAVEVLVVGVDDRQRLRLVVDLEEEVSRHGVDVDRRPRAAFADVGHHRGDGREVELSPVRPVFDASRELRRPRLLPVHDGDAVLDLRPREVGRRLEVSAPDVVVDELHRNGDVRRLLLFLAVVRLDDGARLPYLEVRALDVARSLPEAHEPVRAAALRQREASAVGDGLDVLGVEVGEAEVDAGVVDVAVERGVELEQVPELHVAGKVAGLDLRRRAEDSVLAKTEAYGLPRLDYLVEIAPAVVHRRGRHEVGNRNLRDARIDGVDRLGARHKRVARGRERHVERKLLPKRPLASLRRVECPKRLEVDSHRRVRDDHVVDEDKEVVNIILGFYSCTPQPKANWLAVVELGVDAVEIVYFAALFDSKRQLRRHISRDKALRAVLD